MKSIKKFAIGLITTLTALTASIGLVSCGINNGFTSNSSQSSISTPESNSSEHNNSSSSDNNSSEQSHVHTWGDWSVTLSPTCTTAGEEQRVCTSNESHVETKAIAPMDHSWGDWEIITPATCTAAGKKQSVCANDESHVKTKTIAPTNHSWGAWEIISPADCTTAGEKRRVCANDESHVETKTGTDENAHDWGEWTIVQESTCALEGVSERVCKRNSAHVETQPVEKSNDHKENEEGFCSVCKKQLRAVDVTVETLPTASKIYYGEQSTLSGGKVTCNGETVSGKWTIDSTALSGSSESTNVVAKGVATFTPSDLKNYKVTTAEIDVPMYAVATYNNFYYSRLDDAINAANKANSGTVYALSSNSSTETGKAVKAKTLTVTEIKSGVTLALPYEDTAIVSHASETEVVLAFDKTNYLTNQVSLAKDVTLTVNGKLQIGAIISGKGAGEGKMASFPCQKYAQLTLDDGAKLINKKTVECYGYLTEKTSGTSNGVENFGSLTTPLTILEFHGGTAYVAIAEISATDIFSALTGGINKNPDVAPFNRFYFPSITPILTVRENATLYGYVNLYANGEHNTSTITMVGSDSSALIQLHSGSWLTADLDEKSDITKLDVYGNATMNPMSLKLAITYEGNSISVSLSTKNAAFPINWLYQVGLHTINGATATVNLVQDLKIMPGGSLTVDEGVNVTGSNMIVYGNDMSSTRPADKTSVSNGTVPTYVAPSYDVTYPYNKTKIPNGSLIVNGKMELTAFAGVVQTNSNTGIFTVKTTNKLTVKEFDFYTGSGLSCTAYYYNVTENFTLDLYKNENTSERVENVEVGTYYADNNDWISGKQTFAIHYYLVDENGTQTEDSSNISTYTLATSQLLKSPILSNEAQSFLGWYTDSAFGKNNKIVTLNGIEIFAQHRGELTIYGKIVIAEIYKVNFVTNHSAIANFSTSVVRENGAETVSYDLLSDTMVNATVTAFDNDVSQSKYFGGWYLDEACTQAVTEAISISGDTTVYASWLDKVKLTVNFDNNTSNVIRYLLPNSTFVFDFNTPTKNNSTFKGWSVSSGTATLNGSSVTVGTGNVTIKATWQSNSCLVEGTLVTLYDGTQKKVEDLTADDAILVFNHETGEYQAGKLWFMDHANEDADWFNIVYLEFSDGTQTKLAYKHGYFDLDLNRYVFISQDNFQDFIGHRFVKTVRENDAYANETVTLTNAYVRQEFVKVYGPITEYHFNLVADGILSMPSFNFDVEGFINIFEYDENLRYDQEKMQADIEGYGLFTYEDFKEYMSYEDYLKTPMQYFKVSIAKGYLTYEEIWLTLTYLYENNFAS